MALFDLFKRKAAPQTQADHEPASASIEIPPATPGAPAQPIVPQSKLQRALNRTRAFFAAAFSGDPAALADDGYYADLQEALVLADVGSELASELVEKIRREMSNQGFALRRDVFSVARKVIETMLLDTQVVQPLDPAQLSVVILVGVNGTGKTTLTAKLAQRLKAEGRKVLLAAADTFRAAATDQLQIWAERTGVDVVSGQQGADPSAVVFDATRAAQARGIEVLLVDTAGRLQTKQNLMAELSKTTKTVEKALAGASANIIHLLVLDATVGQNAISQAELFNECCRLTGLAITKLDGTAKGGAVLAVVRKLRIPVLYLGVGERAEDLLDFDAAEFASGLLPTG